MREVQILTGEPTIVCIAEMKLNSGGVMAMAEAVAAKRPEVMPDGWDSDSSASWVKLFPHSMTEDDNYGNRLRSVTDNELLVELAGRKCYDSFGLKAGKKTNAEYIANTQAGAVPHASIAYHAKMSFYIDGVSRRVSHELIRHYVGADRDEEGNPSQESTRYVEHSGRYVAHPRIIHDEDELHEFRAAMTRNYGEYSNYIHRQSDLFYRANMVWPKGMDRKRIFESASPYLSHACETSFIWTTNPMALAKMMKERDEAGADLEYLRLAKVWKRLIVARWPNLFPQPWMKLPPPDAQAGGDGAEKPAGGGSP